MEAEIGVPSALNISKAPCGARPPYHRRTRAARIVAAERIGLWPDEIVSVADGKAKMILNLLAHHHLIRIVMPIGQHAIAIGALKGDRGCKLEIEICY